jgi:drug/metabolite transporter (DMT)-like permease
VSDTAERSAPQAKVPSTKPLGIFAMCGAVLCFSLSSTIVRKAGLPGPTLAFWRMVVTSAFWWVILWVTEHRVPSWDELKRAIIPGAVFGLNITCFFSGVTRTSIANAEFIGALTPLIVVPAGAVFFHEKINLRSLSFGFVSLLGLVLVLFNGPAKGEASWGGNVYIVMAMGLWATYLMTSRRLRSTMSVQAIMAAMMPIAAIAILPIVLVDGEIANVHGTQWLYIVGLAVLTGTVAHGFIVFAQHSVPIGTIGIIQVAQPAIAVGWAFLLLGQDLEAIQLVGMALVIAGLLAVVISSRR